MPGPEPPGVPALAGDRGCYLLVLSLPEPLSLRVARREVSLEAGLYGYAGSAQRGLAARIGRHLRPARTKRPRWHIDRLLALSRVEAALAYPLARPGECWLAARLCQEPGVTLAGRGFGSSDCRCPGHLVAFPRPPDLGALGSLSLPVELVLREG